MSAAPDKLKVLNAFQTREDQCFARNSLPYGPLDHGVMKELAPLRHRIHRERASTENRHAQLDKRQLEARSAQSSAQDTGKRAGSDSPRPVGAPLIRLPYGPNMKPGQLLIYGFTVQNAQVYAQHEEMVTVVVGDALSAEDRDIAIRAT